MLGRNKLSHLLDISYGLGTGFTDTNSVEILDTLAID
jgi:hypothetical protein